MYKSRITLLKKIGKPLYTPWPFQRMPRQSIFPNKFLKSFQCGFLVWQDILNNLLMSDIENIFNFHIWHVKNDCVNILPYLKTLKKSVTSWLNLWSLLFVVALKSPYSQYFLFCATLSCNSWNIKNLSMFYHLKLNKHLLFDFKSSLSIEPFSSLQRL